MLAVSCGVPCKRSMPFNPKLSANIQHLLRVASSARGGGTAESRVHAENALGLPVNSLSQSTILPFCWTSSSVHHSNGGGTLCIRNLCWIMVSGDSAGQHQARVVRSTFGPQQAALTGTVAPSNQPQLAAIPHTTQHNAASRTTSAL